jgi:hypothetical protein
MSVGPVAPVTSSPQTGTGHTLTLPTPGDFSRTLTQGQILKGRVLRHFEGNRYLVDFSGHEKVVDSAVPLQTDEVLFGRVIGVGDHVQLERLRQPAVTTNAQFTPETAIATELFSGDTAKLVAEIFARFNASLGPADAAILNQALRGLPNAQTLVYSALFLSKLSLPFSLQRLEALYRAASADPRHPLFDKATAIYLATQPSVAAAAATEEQTKLAHDPDFRMAIEQALEQLHAAVVGGNAPSHEQEDTESGDGESGRPAPQTLAERLLNLPTEGALPHRVSTIPFLIDGELLELNIAFVDDRGSHKQQSPVAHRRLVISLSTAQLGGLALDASLTGQHLRLKIGADSAASLDTLSAYAGDLSKDMQAAGFQISELEYALNTTETINAPIWAVMESVITADSLNCWM